MWSEGVEPGGQTTQSTVQCGAINLKNAAAARLRRAALHEARNGVSQFIASCALQLDHICVFQGNTWVTSKDS